MQRKLLLGALALVLPIGSVVTLGAGSATANANVTGTGTYSCSKITGTITFNPPIKVAAQTVTITTKSTSTGCKGTAKPLPLSTSSVSSTKTPNASCTGLSKASPVKFTTTFNPVVTPSVFSGTTTSGPSTAKPLYFTLKGAVISGSYLSKATSAKANLQETYSQLVAACTGKGLAILHIISGTSTNG